MPGVRMTMLPYAPLDFRTLEYLKLLSILGRKMRGSDILKTIRKIHGKQTRH